MRWASSTALRRKRINSVVQLPPRSQAIIRLQDRLSTGVHGSGLTPKSQNSGGHTRVWAIAAFTPAA